MRAYSLNVVRILYCLSLAALAGCVSSGAKAPGANAPCKTDDGCPSGYQCLPATTGASGMFCCKDKTSCGSAGSGGAGGSAIDGAIVPDGPTSKGGAIDVASGGGAGGLGIDAAGGGGGGGIGIDGGIAGAGGGGGSPIDVNMGVGGTGGGGVTSVDTVSGGAAGGGSGSGGISVGGAGGRADAAQDVPAPVPDVPTKKAPGADCSSASECAVGFCADNTAGTGKICCASACSNVCQACASDGSACTTKNSGVSDSACGTTSSCHTGVCASGGTCQLASAGANCGTASCSNGVFTAAATCSNSGTCSPGSTGNCGAYACVSATSSSCKSSCTTKSDCASGYTCSGQTCVLPDTTPPTITHVSPSNGTQGVGSDSTIIVTFSEAMDQASVRSALSISGLLSADLGLAWNVGGTVLTVTPKNGLAYNSGTSPSTTTARTYTITISTGATDLTGNALASSYSSSFATLRQITQTISPSVSAHYFDYGVAVDGTVQICASDSEMYEIGYTVGLYASGHNHGLVSFESISLPTNVAGLTSAILSGQQSAPTNSYYSTGIVKLDELNYQAITATGMSWITSATPSYSFGTYSAAYSASTSLDITSQFAAEIGSGQRSFLYQFSDSNGANNAYAEFYCGPFRLTVKYLAP
jgi:hypothetical protein